VTIGNNILSSRGEYHERYWAWVAIGAMIFYTVFLNALVILVLKVAIGRTHRAGMRVW
jgi:hypothetical protein